MYRQGIGLWIVVIALLVLDIGVHCVRAQDDRSKVVKTQDLQILDKSGNEVIDLSSDQKTGGAAITLYDPKGNARMGMYADDTGGVVQMFDASGNTVTELDGSATPGLTFYDNQNTRLALGVGSDGSGYFSVNDESGNARCQMVYTPKDDDSLIGVSDKAGKQTVQMDQNDTRSALLVTDATGTSRAGAVCMPDGSPEFFIDDKNGNDIWTQTDQTDNSSSSSSGSGSSDDNSSDNILHTPKPRANN